ncbi:MAG TPA: tRNA (adenosine(37)-N6)-dimethylallyltransferase MiaA [Steroidobacteraceae bacterium]|jgi:tRNA dimethylallyltransferase|nr:tRNA (adenosine(37)-N6)-dimethylallyltransferase MiaA [Steroidobacteraceae bacterium]
MKGQPVLVLAGPTGTGKTDWALRLAEQLPLEIVSVDSALVYRGLDIGTAKPSRELRARVPHHLIDICEPTESYSAGRFVEDAVALIAAIHERGRVPLLVGGTMLYFRALLRGIAPLPQASIDVRQAIDARAAREGWPALHAELARLDPQSAARIHPNDPQRIQRALEVCYTAGRPISELQQSTRSPLGDTPLGSWALMPANRDTLSTRLERRFREMMRLGFLDEVRGLHTRGDLTPAHPAVRAVGYRQLWAHLDGHISLSEAVRRGITATRQLAKRQMTWIRSEPGLTWVDPFASDAYASWSRNVADWLRQFRASGKAP